MKKVVVFVLVLSVLISVGLFADMSISGETDFVYKILPASETSMSESLAWFQFTTSATNYYVKLKMSASDSEDVVTGLGGGATDVSKASTLTTTSIYSTHFWLDQAYVKWSPVDMATIYIGKEAYADYNGAQTDYCLLWGIAAFKKVYTGIGAKVTVGPASVTPVVTLDGTSLAIEAIGAATVGPANIGASYVDKAIYLTLKADLEKMVGMPLGVYGGLKYDTTGASPTYGVGGWVGYGPVTVYVETDTKTIVGEPHFSFDKLSGLFSLQYGLSDSSLSYYAKADYSIDNVTAEAKYESSGTYYVKADYSISDNVTLEAKYESSGALTFTSKVTF